MSGSGALAEPDVLLHALGEEAELLASSLDEKLLDEPVPGCPGLTAGETARHLGSLYRRLWHWLRGGRQPADWQHTPGPGQSLADYLRSGIAPLLAELAAHRPEETCSTWWTAESNYGFWRRRMAHETAIHRMDVQGAQRKPLTPVTAEFAVDGVDEVLSLWFEHRLMVLGVHATRDATVAVRCGGREWLARATATSTSAVRAWEDTAAVPGPIAVSADDPQAMYRWLWGRTSIRDVTWEGSDTDAGMDAIAQLWALLRIATR
jgi:Mycothiol maleylpyruvate isomerase N-terminal domain